MGASCILSRYPQQRPIVGNFVKYKAVVVLHVFTTPKKEKDNTERQRWTGYASNVI